jgi:phage-related protein
MNTIQATSSLKKITTENSTLEANTLISLYEIDVTDIASTESLVKAFRSINFNYNPTDGSKIFRFHNNLKLINKDIIFNSKSYAALPIEASGFEISSKGTLPTPKLSMVSSSDGDIYFVNFKMFLRYLNGLIGARVTRIRTFVKYIDGVNFYSNWNNAVNCTSQVFLNIIDETLTPPIDFCPDPNAIFPKDVFYVDRKSVESKSLVELELASLIDVQGILLPARIVLEKKCFWQYRGEGCCYEYNANKTATHGSATLPSLANPVANEKDEKIADIVPSYNPNQTNAPNDWQYGVPYSTGMIVKIKIDNINYYFVAKTSVPSNTPPPNNKYWIADQCSKTLKGCKLRWINNTIYNGFLPFGGFPGVQSRG